MAAGDRAAVFTLADAFGYEMAGSVRTALARVGRKSITREELDGLIVDVCLDLFHLAGGWRPGAGALPWVWAERRVRAIVQRWVGQQAERFDPEEVELGTGRAVIGSWVEPGPETEPEPAEVLDRLAVSMTECRLVKEALAATASPRDRAIVLELAVQAALGDHAPAVTVAAMRGMSHDAVRKVASRVRLRLRALVAADARYAPLVGSPLLG
jgi:hypothetical protein